MPDRPNREQVQQFLALMHPQLVDFARESFAARGPGAIRVEAPAVPSVAVPDPFSASMMYQTIEELRRLAVAEPSGGREAALLLPMAEAYDPLRHAVVLFAFTGCEPVAGKVNLVAR